MNEETDLHETATVAVLEGKLGAVRAMLTLIRKYVDEAGVPSERDGVAIPLVDRVWFLAHEYKLSQEAKASVKEFVDRTVR